MYNGIGGHIERGEDVLSAVKREIREEAGITCDPLILCGTVMVNVGEKRGISLYVFKGFNPEGDLRDSVEGTLEWVDMRLFDQYALVEDLPVILPLVHDFKPGDSPFSAYYYYDNHDKLCIKFCQGSTEE